MEKRLLVDDIEDRRNDFVAAIGKSRRSSWSSTF
jgi:hypothetical protein